MIRRAIWLLVLVAAAPPAAAAPPIPEAWMRVQEALSAPTPEGLEERVGVLREAAREVEAHRLTPYAMALVAWARQHPDELGEAARGLAATLDPELPAPKFLAARWNWQSGSYLKATVAYVGGWVALLGNSAALRALLASAGAWLFLAFAAAFATAILVQTLVYLRQLAHDAVELGLVLFRRGNAYVFAAVVLLLPLFAALGPVWLLGYLFALTWAYMRKAQLVAAVVASCAMVAVIPALETWQHFALRVPAVSDRVIDLLDERRIDFSTLREFAELEPDLEGFWRYHLLLGELFRLHGERLDAHVQFQKAAVGNPQQPDPYVFLGNLALEESDLARAVQQYNTAIENDSRCAFAFHNLSFAYDQERRFREGDAAREKARELAGRRVEELGVGGRNPRIRYPRLGDKEVGRLLAEVTSENRLAAALAGSGPPLSDLLLSPLSAAFWVTAVIGILVLGARGRWMWTSSVCVRCGKVFCARCKSATESASYCSQCISVFLKRDVVSIEQQSLKQRQIRRWEVMIGFARRIMAIVLPGSSPIAEGKVWRGLALSFLAWLFLFGALLWSPKFLPSVEPLASALPVQIMFMIVFVLLWLRSAMLGWSRR